MTVINNQDIEALVDNQLAPEDARQVKEALERNPRALKRYIELEQQKMLLNQWFHSYFL